MLGKAKGHPEVGEMVAFLGKGTDFKGVLTFEGTIRVDGYLEGEVHTGDTLIVGESAEIKGNVTVGTIITSGLITGNIVATKMAHLMPPGKLTGDVVTPKLKVDEGFTLNGRCEMSNGAGAAGEVPRKERLSA